MKKTTERLSVVNYMQTFLPYPDFVKSVECLDYRRLGKQRIEARQIHNAIQPNSNSRWRHHPIVKMWRDHTNALSYYINCEIKEWVRRGYKNNIELLKVVFPIVYPQWFVEPDNLPYVWFTQY